LKISTVRNFFQYLLDQQLYLLCAGMVCMQSQSVIYHAQIAYAMTAYF